MKFKIFINLLFVINKNNIISFTDLYNKKLNKYNIYTYVKYIFIFYVKIKFNNNYFIFTIILFNFNLF